MQEAFLGLTRARARQRLATGGTAGGQVRDGAPPPARRAESEELTRRFFEAAAGGDMDGRDGLRRSIGRFLAEVVAKLADWPDDPEEPP